MKLLLDTHIFIWYVRNAPELPAVTADQTFAAYPVPLLDAP
jgi:PIN domain nuclease of toxin-antitoxin system